MGYPGFDYEFNSLQSKEDEFSAAFRSLVAVGAASTTRWTIEPLLRTFAPLLLKLVCIPFFVYPRTCGDNFIV